MTKYISSLDVGTTTVRCQIYNSSAEIISSAAARVKILYPQDGFVEICPNELWNTIITVVMEAVAAANLEAVQIHCMGISTQRATFVTWNRETGKPYHNFITWKDLRSKELVKEWNNSFFMKTLRRVCYGLHLITRNKRYLAGSSINLTSTQATLRLLWIIQNIPELKRDVELNQVMYGTLETWLVHKLTGGATYVTELTNASTTGIFDPFIMDWSSWVFSVMGIPKNIFPPIVGSDYNFGSTEMNIFGTEIPIKCVMADQQASLFGSCCFEAGDILKVTLGTGSFLDVNTGNRPHGSAEGIYPVVAWQLNGNTVYMAEGACNDTGSLMQWALQIGLIDDANSSSQLAESVESSGVYFIPAFSGLGPPITDDKAASGFLGVKPTTTKAHLVRSILESIVFRIILQFRTLTKETNCDFKKIHVDGGVSKNDFVCQMLANMSGLVVERPVSTEISALGVTFMAGINCGIWSSTTDLIKLRKVDKVFIPNNKPAIRSCYEIELNYWLDVTNRFGLWYT